MTRADGRHTGVFLAPKTLLYHDTPRATNRGEFRPINGADGTSVRFHTMWDGAASAADTAFDGAPTGALARRSAPDS